MLSGRTGLNLNCILILFSSHVLLGTKNNSKRKRDDKDSGVRTCCVLNCMVFKYLNKYIYLLIYLALFKESDAEKSDGDLVVDVSNEVIFCGLLFNLLCYQSEDVGA